MNPLLLLIVAFLLGRYLLDLAADGLNLRHLTDTLPSEFKGHYDPERYRASQRYLSDNTRLGIFEDTVRTGVTLLFVLLGGFNVVDINSLHKKIGLPIVTITREKPNFEAMERALKEHFENWQKRLDIIKKGELLQLETKHKPIFVKFIGIDFEEVKKIIELSTVRGALPEAIRIAHLIATGVTVGESYGRA